MRQLLRKDFVTLSLFFLVMAIFCGLLSELYRGFLDPDRYRIYADDFPCPLDTQIGPETEA